MTQYTYHSAGWKTNEVVAGVITNRFRFNGAGDLERLWDGNQSLATSGQAMNGTSWLYDSFGRVRHKVYANNLTNLTYSYDALGRLTNRWIMTNSVSGAGADTEYRYDVNGNLTLVNYPTGTTDVSFQYDALNRVATGGGGPGNSGTRLRRGGSRHPSILDAAPAGPREGEVPQRPAFSSVKGHDLTPLPTTC